MKKAEKSKLKDIKIAAEIVKNGGLIIFPTDTVYGIGCRTDDEKAINRIRKIKKTPRGQMYPLLISNVNQAEQLATITPEAKKLMKKYWPGQLTIILKSKSGQKIGLRLPNSFITRELINTSNTPIIGTSANFHNHKTPTSYKELDKKFAPGADFILKGNCQKKAESTVIDLTVDPPIILRQGAVVINDFKN